MKLGTAVILFCILGIAASISTGGCMFPTKGDVNDMRQSDLEHREGLAAGTVSTMTEQHKAMTEPEVDARLEAMAARFMSEIKVLRAEADKAVATGPDFGDLGEGIGGLAGLGANDIITGIIGLLTGGSLWSIIGGMFKPSRATPRIDALEKSTTDRIKEIELALATAAKAGAAVPSDGPGLST